MKRWKEHGMQDAGAIVDYLDIENAAMAITELSHKPSSYYLLGIVARKRYLAKHTEDAVYNAFTAAIK